MKKLLLIALCLAVVCSLAACSNGGKTDTSEPSDDTQVSEAPEQSAPEDIVESLDYDGFVTNLGSLTTDPGWEKVEDIPVDKLVMWYGYRVIAPQSDNAELMSFYMVEGKDGLFIPANEFEAEILRHFGLKAEHLRADTELFDEEAMTYATPAALFDLAETSYKITRIVDEVDFDVIYFDLTIAGAEPVERALTVVAGDKGTIYSSYTNGDGEVDAVPPEEDEESEGEGEDEASTDASEAAESAPEVNAAGKVEQTPNKTSEAEKAPASADAAPGKPEVTEEKVEEATETK